MECPVSFAQISFYLQILIPAYRFSITIQRTNSNISEVVPSLLYMFNEWSDMAKKYENNKLCLNLIECFKTKFAYELDSNLYAVASIFDTSKMYIWHGKEWSSARKTKAYNSLISVAFTLIDKKKQQEK